MTFIKSFFIAVSMYSQIPVIQFEWKEKEMKFAICFFPFVGVVISLLLNCWIKFCSVFCIADFPKTLLLFCIPVFITGGIHLDGFMDTCDALSSYRDIETRHKILKDPHIGAFAVIKLVLFVLVFLAALSFIPTGSRYEFNRVAFVWSLSFVLSRILSAISVITFKTANKNGTLSFFSSKTEKLPALIILIMQAIMITCIMIFFVPVYGIAIFLVSVLCFVYYSFMSNKMFAGTTGDIAGWFVCICELFSTIAVAIIFLFTTI